MGKFENFEQFLALFPEKPRQRIEQGYNVLCPAHNDKNPSLSVSQDTDKILLHCQAGCPTPEILTKLNLLGSDLFMPDLSMPIIETTYSYHDEKGQLLFEIVRYKPKSFKARKPTGNDNWEWNIQGIRPVLYHLPDIKRAIVKGDTVYISEGERDCDSLWSLGLVATTNPFGANKWKDEYSESLQGAKAIIIPDNDNEGQKHALSVIDSLEGKVKSLAVLQIPLPAKDITEWLEQGHSQRDFLLLKPVSLNEYKNNTLTSIPAKSLNNRNLGQPEGQDRTTSPAKWGEYAKRFDEIMREEGSDWQDKRDIAGQLGTTYQDDTFRKLIQRRKKDEIIRVHGGNPFLIRWINRDYKIVRLTDTEKQTFLDILLPLNIHELAQIPPGAVIGLAGYISSGKTAFLLEMAELNALSQSMPVYYWFNEMSTEKMIIRCEDFPLLFEAQRQKRFFPVKQGDFEFADVIEPNGINLIDYLDRDEELFLIGKDIKQLQRRLDKGIVVFAQQKPQGRKFGYGGLPSAKLSNLYIALDRVAEYPNYLQGRASIVKCKDWAKSNPVDMVCEYLTGGLHGRLFVDSEWKRN